MVPKSELDSQRPALLLTALHRLYGFLGRQYSVCERSEIDKGGRIAIAPFVVLWSRRRIFCDGYLEALLEQLAQVRFDAHVGEHTAKNDLAFAELENEVVGLWPPHPVRCGYDGFAILDVGLKTLQPVCTGPFEAIEI